MDKLNKALKPTAWHQYKGRSIMVFDHLFTPKLVEALGIMIGGLKYERSPSFDKELSAPIEINFFAKIPKLPEMCDLLLQKHYRKMSVARAPQKLNNVYAASMRYGDHSRIHKDYGCPNCVTFLYYGNLHWDPNWGGETIFYNDRMDALYAVTPKPGRLVAFNAQIFHRTGVPARDCSSSRYGLSAFFRCNDFLMPELRKS